MVPNGRIEVRLLGPVEVAIDGEPVDLGGVRQRLLVARLGLAVGRPVPVPALLDLLWPGEVPDSAIGNLQSYVSRVRRRIGKERIVKDPGGYRLALDRSEVDASRVEDTLARLDELDVRARADQLDRARRSWRGSSLSDVADWHGLLPDAVGLDELRLRVVERWAEAVLDIDRHDLALSVLPSLAGQHPTSEAIHVALMEALAQGRRTDDALRVGHRFRVALAETTGLQPSEDLSRLEQRLLSDPHPAGAATPASPGVPLPPPNSFVGRDRELQRLARTIEPPGVAEIVGPAGAGKTRLVLEHLRRAPSERPVRFVDLAKSPQSEPLVTGLAGALGLSTADSAAEIADAMAVDSILVCDNCEHRAAEAGDFAAEVVRRRRDVTVVSTSRVRLLADSRCLDLAPLSDTDATQLFLDRVGQHRSSFDPATVEAADLEAVIGIADGLPLAVELLSGRERIVGLHGLAHHTATDRFAARAEDLLPELLTQLNRSYQAISTRSRALLRSLSVTPGPFELSVVEQLTDHPMTTLAELIDASLVAVEHAPDVRYRLLESVRAVGISHLEPSERETTRAALADWAGRSVARWREDQDRRLPGPTTALREHSALIDAALTWMIEAERNDDAARLAVNLALIVSDDPSADWLQRLRLLAPPPAHESEGEANALFALAAAIAAWIAGDIADCERLLDIARPGLGARHDLRWCIDLASCVAAVYRGGPEIAERHARAVHDSSAPDFFRATALCAAALAHTYSENRTDATRLMALDTPLLADIGRGDGFIDFSRAELCSHDDPPAAVALLERARLKCQVAGHSYNQRIASIAHLGLLIRTDDTDRATRLAPDLVADCCHSGMWPQAWIVGRLCAEVLANGGNHLDSATLIDAAIADPTAPTVTGRDLDRIRCLRARCHDALSGHERRQVQQRVDELRRSDLPAFVMTALRRSA